MPVQTETKPISDSVPKVNDEIAVGSDLAFQRRWWSFERGVWIFLTILLVMAVLGCFGRGPVAQAHQRAKDGSLDLRYERIERFGTPSEVTVGLSPGAAHAGRIKLWVSDELVKPLGNRLVIPEPLSSELSGAGIQYTFPAVAPPYSVEFSLEPEAIGVHDVTFRAEGAEPVRLRIYVLP